MKSNIVACEELPNIISDVFVDKRGYFSWEPEGLADT